jgi:Papain family cysteine protease
MKIRSVLLLVFVILSSLVNAQQKYRLGLAFSDYEYKKVPKRYFSVRGNRTPPPAYSLKQYCPKPLSQLGFSTSAGWAVGYAALTIIRAQQNNWQGVDITRNASSPIFPYFKAKPDSVEGSNTYVTLRSVIEALKIYGTPYYRVLPSRTVDHVSKEIERKAAENRISEYARLYDKHDGKFKKIAAIKSTLNDNLPVVASLHVSNSFFYAKEFWQPRDLFNKELPGHAITIIGYDDNKYGGSFEIMNSWGTEWGNDGFMWIRYGDFIQYTEEAFDLYVIPGSSSGVQLGGSMNLTLLDDHSPMEIVQLSPGYYKIAKSYPSGTLFTIKINNESPAFIYAFASDLTGEVASFFPPSYTSAALSKAASFYVADEDTPAVIDETLGTDYLCVIFSKEDLDIINIINIVENGSGSFANKVKTALDGKLISNADIRYETNQISFKMRESKKAVVMLIVEHDHR